MYILLIYTYIQINDEYMKNTHIYIYIYTYIYIYIYVYVYFFFSAGSLLKGVELYSA